MKIRTKKFTAVLAIIILTASGITYSVNAAEADNINGVVATDTLETPSYSDAVEAADETPIDSKLLELLNALGAVENQVDSDAGVPEDTAPKKKNKDKLPDYQIKVNLTTNTVTIYIKDEKGSYIPYRAMVCSIGRKGHETPEGTFSTSDYYSWRLMVDNTYGRYAVRFNHGIMFHSVPYFYTKKDSLEWLEYNKLGRPASLGCIRLAVADAKWIFDNCKKGTSVTVYSGDPSTDPLGTPTPIRIATSAKFRDWDPTDLTPENPWLIPVE